MLKSEEFDSSNFGLTYENNQFLKKCAAKIFARDYQSLTKITPTLGESLNYL